MQQRTHAGTKFGSLWQGKVCTLYQESYRQSHCASLLCVRKRDLFFCYFREFIAFLDHKSLSCDPHERKTPQRATNRLKALPQIQTKLKAKPQNLQYSGAKFPPASHPLVKQQHPDAWINVATNNCNVSDCELYHGLPDALLRRNGMLMQLNLHTHYCSRDSLH